MRYTETKLDKLIRIHHGMVDRIMEQACEDLEAIKPADTSGASLFDLIGQTWLNKYDPETGQWHWNMNGLKKSYDEINTN